MSFLMTQPRNTQLVGPRRFVRWVGLFWMGSLLAVQAQMPATNAPIIFSLGEGGYGFRIPCLVAATNGTVLAICEGRKSSSDFGDIDIVLKRSTNNGVSWSPLSKIGDYKAVITGEGDLTMGNPCAILDQITGKIILLANTGNTNETSIDAGVGTRRIWVTDSEDAGLSWSACGRLPMRSSHPTGGGVRWGRGMAFKSAMAIRRGGWWPRSRVHLPTRGIQPSSIPRAAFTAMMVV